MIEIPILLLFSLALLIVATVICYLLGLFDGDTYSIGSALAFVVYLLLWVIPSLIAWVVKLTWFATHA
jgi:type III secretory pathway component EscS